MADTKWLDPENWTLADWEDDTLTVIVSALWDTLKGASDERQAFIEQEFSASFNTDNEFPDFNQLMSIFLSGGAVTPNDSDRIENALNNTSGTYFDFVKTDTLAANGTTVVDSVRADYISLSDMLTDVFGYSTGTLLHVLDTLSGNRNAILKMAWVKQWYEVLNYTQYYARQIINVTDDFFSEIQTQATALTVIYTTNNVLGTLNRANANYTNPPNPLIDLYVANDLNETAPFSTPQEVYDYTELTFSGQASGADWETVTDVRSYIVASHAGMNIELPVTGAETKYTSGISRTRIRFKVTDNKRALSPNTYISVLKQYLFLIESATNTFNDFNIGLNERETNLFTLSPDGSDYYYLEQTTQPDFTLFTVPPYPATDGTTENNGEGYRQFSLNENTNVTTPVLGSNFTDILIEANNSDGTSFEYYSP